MITNPSFGRWETDQLDEGFGRKSNHKLVNALEYQNCIADVRPFAKQYYADLERSQLLDKMIDRKADYFEQKEAREKYYRDNEERINNILYGHEERLKQWNKEQAEKYFYENAALKALKLRSAPSRKTISEIYERIRAVKPEPEPVILSQEDIGEINNDIETRRLLSEIYN